VQRNERPQNSHPVHSSQIRNNATTTSKEKDQPCPLNWLETMPETLLHSVMMKGMLLLKISMTFLDSREMSLMITVCFFSYFFPHTLTRLLIEHTRLLSGAGPYPGEGREGSRAPSVEYARTRQASKGYENESNYGRDRQPSVAYNQTMPWNNVENLSDIMRGMLIQIAQRLGYGADVVC